MYKNVLRIGNHELQLGIEGVPVLIFLLFFLTYLLYAEGISIDKVAGGIESIKQSIDKMPIREAMYRNFWGVSLVVAGMANLILILFCLFHLFFLKSENRIPRYWVLSVLFLGIVTWVVIVFQDLGGGIVHAVYEHTALILDEFKLPIYFRSVINITVANGYLGVFLISILLSRICFIMEECDFDKGIKCIKIYRRLMFITAIFLSTSILQMFFQYQWFSTFLSSDKSVLHTAKLVTFGIPLAMSVFYVTLFLSLFLPVGELLYNSAINCAKNCEGVDSDESAKSMLAKNSGIYEGVERTKPFFLFFSPILTALLAETIKNF